MSLALEQLLCLPGLQDMRVRAGARHLQRRVRWPYVAENEGIAEWVMGGELCSSPASTTRVARATC